MKGTWLTIIIGIVLVIIGGVILTSGGGTEQTVSSGTNTSTSGSTDPQDLDQVPDFTLPNYAGEDVALADSAGKVRVINSWATWCPFCVDELPDFARLQEEFGDEIVVIAIDRSESVEKAKGFTDELGISDDLTFLMDSRDRFYTSIGGFAMPETLFVDGDGNIHIHKRGPMEFEEMKQKVEQVLAAVESRAQEDAAAQ